MPEAGQPGQPQRRPSLWARLRAHPVRWGRFNERTPIQVPQVSLPLARLPEAFDGFRIALISDLHYGQHAEASFVARVAEIARAQQPDLVLFCGDLVDRAGSLRGEILQHLGRLACRLACIAVLGNHEYYGGADVFSRRLRPAGVEILVNRHRLIRRTGSPGAADGEALLAVAGLDDLRKGRPDFQAALGGIPPGTFTVLVGHSPDLADRAPPRPTVDLMLAGHTHGGQVCLLGRALVTETRNPRYVSGLVQAPFFPMFISRGLGVTGVPLRIGSEPELPVLTLRRSAARGADFINILQPDCRTAVVE